MGGCRRKTRRAKPAAASKAAIDKARAITSQVLLQLLRAVNLLSALLQALVVARLLTWLGIRRALFIMRWWCWAAVALLLFANMTLVRVEKTTENSLDYSSSQYAAARAFLPTSRAGK